MIQEKNNMKKETKKNKEIIGEKKKKKDLKMKKKKDYFQKTKKSKKEIEKLKRRIIIKKIIKETIILIIIAILITTLIKAYNQYQEHKENQKLINCLKEKATLYGYDFKEKTQKQKLLIKDLIKEINYVNCAFKECPYEEMTWEFKTKNKKNQEETAIITKILNKKELETICYTG